MSCIKPGLVLSCVALAAAFGAPAMAADTYPSRAVELVIPYPPGGPNDVIGRALGDEMSKSLGQPFVIRNQPGAGGNVATAAVARSKPDGYTLVLPAMAYAVNPFIFKSVNYQYSDFAAVSMVVQGPLVLVAHPSLGVKTVQELLTAAKASPGKIEYASGGVGTSLHLAGELFKAQSKVDMLHVPYKGTGEAMPDLLSGRVGLMFSSPLTVHQHVQGGKLNALGTTGTGPVPGWGELPAIAQTVPGYEMTAWYSLMAAAGTPPEILRKLNEAVRKAQESDSFKQKMLSLGMEMMPSSSQEAEAFIKREIDKWEKLVKQTGITAG